MDRERDYILGTHDDEVARLELQHRVWRSRVLDAWRRAGFTTGQTLVDAGAGPGHATIDLAELAGPHGRVVAIERSRRFLDSLRSAAARRELGQVQAIEADLESDPLPAIAADGAWVRWVFAFVNGPKELLRRMRSLLRPGGVLVVHEYFDYRTWRLTPRSAVFEHFVDVVVKSWRASGGDPDVGLDLPAWMRECGFRIRELRPHVEVIAPSDSMWAWPKAFIATGKARLEQLGSLTREEAAAIRETFVHAEADADTRCVTPAVLEIIAEAV